MNEFFNPIKGAYINSVLDSYLSSVEPTKEFDEIFRLRSARNRAFVGSKLLAMQRRRHVTQHTMNAAIERVSAFMDAMAIDFANDNQMVQFNDFMNECISVTFRKRADLRVNINLNSNPDDKSDEALIMYSKEGRTYMQNDSLNNTVMIVKELLDL